MTNLNLNNYPASGDKPSRFVIAPGAGFFISVGNRKLKIGIEVDGKGHNRKRARAIDKKKEDKKAKPKYDKGNKEKPYTRKAYVRLD